MTTYQKHWDSDIKILLNQLHAHTSYSFSWVKIIRSLHKENRVQITRVFNASMYSN
jgi:hypothetical protein